MLVVLALALALVPHVALAVINDILVGTFYASDTVPENVVLASRGSVDMRRVATLYPGGAVTDASGGVHPGHVDPSIVYHDGLWWSLSAWNRHDGLFWPVLSYSRDLVHWTFPEGDALLRGTHGVRLATYPYGYSSQRPGFDVVAPEFHKEADGSLWIVFSAGFFGNFHAGHNSLDDNMQAYYVRVKTLSADPDGAGEDLVAHMTWPKSLTFEVDGIARLVAIPGNSGASANLIDGSMVSDGGRTYLFIKRDGLNNQAYVTDDLRTNAWRQVNGSFLFGWEGLSVVRLGSDWLAVADKVSGFTATGTTLFQSTSPTSGGWSVTSSQPTRGLRHGSLFVARKGTDAWRSADAALRTDISGATVAGLVTRTHTGSAIRPVPRVVVGGRDLVYRRDYTCSWADNVHVGKARVTIRGIGDYRGTRKASFTIARRGLRTGDASLASRVVTYTGVAAKPRVVMSQKAWQDDVKVSYKDNVHAGTATVVVRGRGDLKGSLTLRFTVRRVKLATGNVGSVASVTYTGGEHKPSPVVTFRGRALVRGRDYAIAYAGNVRVGTAVVTVRGRGDFAGTVTRRFKISCAKASDLSVVVTTPVRWAGSARRPRVVVRLGKRTLKRGTDYALTWSRNDRPGRASVTVNGRGGVKGRVTRSFDILPASLKASTTTVTTDPVAYSPGKVTPRVIVRVGNVTMRAGTDYVVDSLTSPPLGATDVIVRGRGRTTGTVRVPVTVTRRSLSSDGVVVRAPRPVTATGGEVRPEPTVSCDGKRLVLGTDYALAWSGNVGVGMGTVSVSGRGSYVGTRVVNFDIRPAEEEPQGFTFVVVPGNDES